MSVTVQYGAVADALDIAGRTVCEARESLKRLYSIPDDAVATLNNSAANDNDVLRDGDTLSFSKPLASKGTSVVILTVTVGR